MCMQCVAQSTPMVAAGLTVLRREAFLGFVRRTVTRPLALLRRA
jgi:hypothetical protein